MPVRSAIAVALPAPVERSRELFWPLLAGAAAVAALIPLWSSQVLPYQDAPQHLASIRVLADYHTPGFGFDRWFEIDLKRLQYLGFYLPAAGLAKLFGPDAACRLMLSLIALALPASLWMLLGAFGRDRRLAVFAPLVFHTMPLYMGFFNYMESVPAAVAVVALTERQLREPARGRGIALASGAGLLLWLHPSALAFAIACAVALAWTSGQPRQRVRRTMASFLPALALLGLWVAQALASRDGEGHAARTPPSWLPLETRILDALRFGNVLAGHADEICVGLCVLLLLAAAIPRDKPRAERSWRLPLLAAMTLAAYFAAPFDIGYMGYIEQRALPFLFLLAIASFRVSSSSRIVSAACAAAVLAQLGYGIASAEAYRAFDREAEIPELQEVLRAARPGERLIAQIWDQGSRVVQFQPYMHFAAYYQVQRGGRARYNFAETPWTPVRFRAGTEPPAMRRSWELHPEWTELLRDAPEEEYLLVRGPGPTPARSDGFRSVASAGRWTLYGR